MKYERLQYVLNNGRVFESYSGLIHPEDKETIIVEDGQQIEEYKVNLEERKEIAEYMIELWKEWAK